MAKNSDPYLPHIDRYKVIMRHPFVCFCSTNRRKWRNLPNFVISKIRINGLPFVQA